MAADARAGPSREVNIEKDLDLLDEGPKGNIKTPDDGPTFKTVRMECIL